MSLHILHSNRVEKLLDHLSGKIRKPHPDAGPLDGETVLLDNRVLGKWLNLKLASKNSVAANIRYVQPAEVFWELSRVLVSSDIPRQTPLSKEEMTWRLMGLLEQREILDLTVLKPVKTYLAANSKQEKFTDLKRFQLAAGVADLFDQYLIYRPEWINEFWDRNKSINSARDNTRTDLWRNAEAWQRRLWHEMVIALDRSATLHHRAAIQNKLFRTLEGDLKTNDLKFRRLFVFGVTSMPEAYIDLLMLLGRHMDIYLYVLNPCEHEWFEIRSKKRIVRLEQRLRSHDGRKTEYRKRDYREELQYMEVGNPLLAGQATQVQDYIELIYEKTDQYQLHAEIQDFDCFDDPGEESLLCCIQKEILELQYCGEVAKLESSGGKKLLVPKREITAAGKPFQSIHIHNCHSPQREVEVLHDQLLGMFDQDEDLKPRDVVVMMPRVAPYVPFINAVFASAAKNQRIKYHIADRTLQEESPLLNSFETLLKLPDSRLPLSEILGLLEVPAIQRRFGLDREDYEQLKAWLIASGARWGLDASQRKEIGLPAYSDFSWDFGLSRLLAGYAMQADVGANDEGAITGLLEMTSTGAEASPFNILPMDDVEGGGAIVLDSFLRFWRVLKKYRSVLNRRQGPLEWKELLSGLLEDFYEPEDEEWRALNELRRGFGDLELAGKEGNNWYEGELPLEVIRAMMQPVLQRPGNTRHPWSEGVKFCSLLPMRGVPFKVVYLLGMNMGDYPRRVEAKSFDLMRNHYKPGDRSARTDDRWLFLEAFLSARKAFHVSYIGQDMHRNEKREPSVVLAELIDYIRDGYALPEDAEADDPFTARELKGNSFLYTRHPLQPFNPVYFQEPEKNKSSLLFSFSRQAFEVADGQLNARKKDPPAGDARWSKVDPPATGIVEVSLADFVKFFTRPWDWFFSKKGISLGRYDEEVSDEELFELQPGLGSWMMRDRLLKQLRFANGTSAEHRDLEIERFVATQKASGSWPIGPAGGKEENRLRQLLPEYVFMLSGKTREVEKVSVTVPDVPVPNSRNKTCTLRISGDLERFGDEFLVQSAGKVSEKYLLDFYIRLALGCADPEFQIASAQIIFATNAKNVPAAKTIKGMEFKFVLDQEFIRDSSRHDALIYQLAGLYLEYHRCGLPFHPGFSLELPGDEVERLVEIETKWFGTGYDAVGCIKNDIKQRAYYGSPTALNAASYLSVSESVWRTFKAWLTPKENNDGE